MATPVRTIRVSNELWAEFTSKVKAIKLTKRNTRLTVTSVVIGLILMFVDGDIQISDIIAKLNKENKMEVSSENGSIKEVK